ncbi:hypothetical protein ACKI1K_45000, partial [Streptomyces scabiei]|uniref:hypothetical protein n=1 Tax=Streptomyces scabiei TaxID=1930 RepID=UPI0038F66F24
CITRDGAWTINVICLELFGKNATYPYESDPGFDYNMVIDSTNNAHRDLVNKISDNMVRISHHNLVSIIDGMPDKKEWKDSMLLRYAKP